MTLRKWILLEWVSSTNWNVTRFNGRKIRTEGMIMLLILRTIIIVCTVILLSTPVEADSSRLKNSGQEAIVAQLYRDFAWEAVMQQPSWIGLMDQPREILERYFDKQLTTLILRDRACAEKEGMCRLSFLPIWASQDPSASDLKVQQSDKAEIVLVKFRYPSTDETVTLMYQLTNTSNGWRISDISGVMNGAKWSLLSILNSQR